jgi:hypothetical protein
VIARQDQDKVGARVLDDLKILKYGVSRTSIPFSAYRASADKDFVAIVAWRNSSKQVPDMRMQGFALILSQDIDPAKAGVQTVGEREIDQAIYTAKRNGGLSSALRQRMQALTLPTGENEC